MEINDNEFDLVVFQDEDGNEITMEVLDYFFYEGEEYATLTEYTENNPCEGCDKSGCDGCDPVEVAVMKVVPVGEDEEEFIPVDEELGNKLLDMLDSGAFDDDSMDEE